MTRDFFRHRTRKPRLRGVSSRPESWRPERGITLVELMLVVAIIMIVTALAMPSIVNTIAAVKVRSGMSDLSGMLQHTRMAAVKQNRIKFLQFTTKDSRVLAYIDDAASPTGLTPPAPFAPPPQLLMSPEFARVDAPGGGCPALDATTMWGGGAAPDSGKDNGYFTSLGAPCQSGSYTSGGCKVGNGFVYYFSYTQNGSPRWTALGVSAAGRSKSFYCSGGKWGS